MQGGLLQTTRCFWTGKKKIKRVCSRAKFDESVHYQLQVRIVKNRSYKPNKDTNKNL